MTQPDRLYRTRVMHRRLFPVEYRFTYRVFSLLVDVDKLDDLNRSLRLLSVNRFNLLGLNARDHGPRDGSPWRPWVDACLGRAGIDLEGGQVQLLCFPRVLGYTFNPLSLWYCRHRDGSLRAVICEVSNTLGDHHHYLLHADGAPMAWPVRASQDKLFYVSPFIEMDARYQFRLSEPDEALNVLIHEYQDSRLMLSAAQTGHARPLTDGELLKATAAVPFMTLKVLAAIHWHALKIWWKGGQYYSKPTPS
ncbi:DUF1365 domain-containing protein [Ectothiorhodospira lacustris]|uniref:DUF1365 domain-containing protein n=1 Tax=Ectothiorhodospira lacustris TaxID=2899127 RepID=UPI001EE83877|nr:DUF1365 domain-containing protein [Ectothiorhodospira lacustris]MCG5510058.1 DUF1365 domain-containing protein [Ectothiorhodospira lacustris]MCG5521804.1 DUF1365 domain-containing protein [Ectothiorhodospira lacustris]